MLCCHDFLMNVSSQRACPTSMRVYPYPRNHLLRKLYIMPPKDSSLGWDLAFL